MTTTPAGPQPPTTPTLGEWQPLPARPGPTTADKPETAPLTRPQKWLIGVVAGAVLTIAALGFVGSYAAVAKLAVAKGFGAFAHVFPAAIDAGIIAFLALDLLLTWLRIPYPLLRQAAWLLTAATIAFNAATAWGDQLAVGMHAVIPVLFVIAVEAARHAIGRIADITADKHIESPPLSRWLLAPVGTYRIWRRMRLWNVRSYEQVIAHQLELRAYKAQLRKDYGRGWRRAAPAEKLFVARLAADGMSIAEAIALPEVQARKRSEAKLAQDLEAKRAETEAKRLEAEAEAEALRVLAGAEAEAEAKRRAEAEADLALEAKRAEVKRKAEAEEVRQAEATRLLKAETEAKIADIETARQQAEAEAETKRLQQETEKLRLQAEADRLDRKRQEDEQRARLERELREAEAKRKSEAAEQAKRITTEALRAPVASGLGPEAANPKSASTSGPAASGSASAPGAANLGSVRSKRATEVEAVLTKISEAGDPKAVSLEWVMDHFGLKQTTAYDRLATAQKLWAQAQNAA